MDNASQGEESRDGRRLVLTLDISLVGQLTMH